MLITSSLKSSRLPDHVQDLREIFTLLRRYKMKLNPAKCSFEVESEKFLGFMVNQRENEGTPKKIRDLLEMKSPRRVKEFQCLTRHVPTLCRFVSKATNRCQPFFQALKGRKDFVSDEKCKAVFQELKV